MQIQNKHFETHLSTNLIFGIESSGERLIALLESENIKKILIATDLGIFKSGILDKILNKLEENKISFHIFNEIEPNPLAETVMRGKMDYNNENCEMIVAIGGGSVIDFAKCVSAMVVNPGHVLDYRRGKSILKHQGPKIIVMPTTVGTGAEVTSSAVISDPISKRKYVIASSLIVPQYTIIDPTLTLTLPSNLVATTGMDALVHAIEAYVSLEANPLSQSFAVQAMKMLIEYLPASYANASNIEARSQIHLASTLAGFAFNIGKLGIVHSCSHPLSAHFNVPHGLANAVILPYVLEFNKIANTKKFAEIARMFNPDLISTNDTFAADQLSSLVFNFNEKLGIPSTIEYLNLDINDEVLNRLALDAMDDLGTFPFNPRKASYEDIIKIYTSVFNYKKTPQLESIS